MVSIEGTGEEEWEEEDNPFDVWAAKVTLRDLGLPRGSVRGNRLKQHWSGHWEGWLVSGHGGPKSWSRKCLYHLALWGPAQRMGITVAQTELWTQESSPGI